MKLLYKSLLFLMIFICSVGSVCATDTDNITVDNSLSDVNSNVEIVDDIGIFNIYSDNVIYNNNYYHDAIVFQSAVTSNNINIALNEPNNSNITINIHK